jgi:hypothetical protein
MDLNSPNLLSVNCNHCGATLEVDEETRFVTCNYCHSRLGIQRTGSAAFTQVLEKLEQQTGQIAGNLKVIELQNELDQLDREWAMSRENLMVSGRDGARSEPSMAGGVMTIVIGVAGGVAWMVFTAGHGAPGFFPLFGLIFVVIAVAGGLSSISKAGQLGHSRGDYATRRQQLVSAIEAEKQRQ